MAYLNQFLTEGDLAGLTGGEREFLVQRIDHILDTHPEVRGLVAEGLKGSLGALKKPGVGIREESVKTAAF